MTENCPHISQDHTPGTGERGRLYNSILLFVLSLFIFTAHIIPAGAQPEVKVNTNGAAKNLQAETVRPLPAASIGDSIEYPGRSAAAVKNLSKKITTLRKSFSDKRTDDYRFKADLLEMGYIHRLSQAIHYKTVSAEKMSEATQQEFRKFHQYLQMSYPRVHDILTREVVKDYSLLYTWKGTNSRKKPIMLIAHMDVVPVEEHAHEPWVHPAFAGKIDSGYIWGRGAMDNKSSVMGILEAVETLLAQGYQPERDIYLAFGHDEEVLGTGAQGMSALLQERGLKFACILDEGGSIISDVFPQLGKPLALIGIAEKGYLTLELSVSGEGGHSSVPSSENVVSILGTAIYRLQTNTFKPTLTTPVKQMLRAVGEHVDGIEGFVMSNPTFFAKILKNELSKNPVTNSLIQTTIAPTMIEAGVKDNVLPTTAQMTINFRILPGETVDQTIHRVKKVIDDKRVKIKALSDASNPPKVTSIRNRSYKTLKKTIEQVFPEVVVAPYLNISTSDSRHYTALSDNILRFVPLWLNEEDSKRFHGNNERIGIDTYRNTIKFYHQFLVNFDSGM